MNYKCAGFLYINDRRPTTDPEDLYDFIGRNWSSEEITAALAGNVLPEGMILKGAEKTMVIRRAPLGGLSLKNLTDILETGAN